MARVPHAVRGKEAEAKVLVGQHRKQDDQHQPEPELRQRDADERAGRQEVIEPRILFHRCHDPDRDGDQEREDVGGAHQQDGVGQPLGDQADRALVAEIRKPQVKVQQVAHVGQVLNQEGAVEAVVVQQSGPIRGRHPGVAQQQVPWLLRQNLQDGEEDEGDDEQKRDRLQDAANDVFGHAPTLSPHPKRVKRSPGTEAPLAWADGPAPDGEKNYWLMYQSADWFIHQNSLPL